MNHKLMTWDQDDAEQQAGQYLLDGRLTNYDDAVWLHGVLSSRSGPGGDKLHNEIFIVEFSHGFFNLYELDTTP